MTANPESAAAPLRELVEEWLRDNVDDEGQICLCADPECFQKTASNLTTFISAYADSLIETAIAAGILYAMSPGAKVRPTPTSIKESRPK